MQGNPAFIAACPLFYPVRRCSALQRQCSKHFFHIGKWEEIRLKMNISIKHPALFICKSREGRFYNSWVIYVSSHKKRLLLCSLRPRISQNLLSVTPFNNLSLTQYTFKLYRFFFAVWTPSVSILYWFQLKWLAENNT